MSEAYFHHRMLAFKKPGEVPSACECFYDQAADWHPDLVFVPCCLMSLRKERKFILGCGRPIRPAYLVVMLSEIVKCRKGLTTNGVPYKVSHSVHNSSVDEIYDWCTIKSF